MNPTATELEQTRSPWGTLALLALAAWAFLLGITPTTTNDMWYHMRMGGDILATGHFPRTDSYSALAHGRPFIYHEWLSGVIFHLLGQFDWLITMFRASAICSCFWLLYLGLAKTARHLTWTLPLLALSILVINMRVLVRPHLFTLVLLCLLMFLLERWRVHRKAKTLWLLPPIFALWVNLHGAYLFGIAILGLWTLVTAAMWLFPSLHRTEEVGKRYNRAQVRSLAMVGITCILATLINPYGYHIWLFSMDFAGGHDFIKTIIGEWIPTFQLMSEPGQGYFHLWALCFMAALAILLLTALLRLTKISLLDLAMLCVGVYFSIKANRFTPYLVILGYAGAVRGLKALAESKKPPRRLQALPWLNLGIATLLLVWIIKWGYATDITNQTSYKPLGFGFAGKKPAQAMEIIKSLGWQGGVFNEYSAGAYIIHDLHPQVRPIMDSRIDIYGEKLWNEYWQALNHAPSMTHYLEKYPNINMVLLELRMQRKAHLKWLGNSPDWRFVDQGEKYILYKRR